MKGRKPLFLHTVYFLCCPELWDLNLLFAWMALGFGLFCASFCENPWVRIVSKSGLWVGTSVWLIRSIRFKEYNIYVKGASPNSVVKIYWSVHTWGCLLLHLCGFQLQELSSKRELGWLYSTGETQDEVRSCPFMLHPTVALVTENQWMTVLRWHKLKSCMLSTDISIKMRPNGKL